MAFSKITYSLDQCKDSSRDPKSRDYHDLYNLLSEEDIRMVAKVYKFNKVRLEKLINHKNKKFNRILKTENGIYKIHHDQPVETMSSGDKRQPLFLRLAELLKSL